MSLLHTFFTMQNNYVINYTNLTALSNLQNKYASMNVQPSKFIFLNIILQNFFQSYICTNINPHHDIFYIHLVIFL